MITEEFDVISTDVLIIGGGGAGMRAAIAAAKSNVDVTLMTKGQAARSGATPMACPSYQAAFAMEDPRDNPDIAFEDTCYEGRYLGDENLIKALTSEATERAMEMLDFGVKFRRKDDGTFLQVVHPGHTYERNLVIVGNGYAMAAGLRREMLKQENVRLLEDVVSTKIMKDGDRIAGAVALDMRSGRPLVIRAIAIILATGGYPELWRWTDTEPGLTGEGVYQAYEVGADLVDMEMMLYYPTGLCYPPEVEGTLVQYEGLLTEKYCAGVMLNGKGEPFLPPTERLPVRDVMMKLMFREIEAGRSTPYGGVYIDLRKSPRPSEEIREILTQLDSLPYNQLNDLGINVLEEPIEVMPVTHYTLGGVRINEWAETTFQGLYAAGEVSGNIHGANRTSGNALAETQVFGKRAGSRAAEYVSQIGPAPLDRNEIGIEISRQKSFLAEKDHGLRPIEIKREIKTIMHSHLHYQRSAEGIQTALDNLLKIRHNDLPRLKVVSGVSGYNYEWEEAIEVVHMQALSELVAYAALSREESRGHHWRTDFPEMRLEWEKHTIVRRTDDGCEVSDAPVVRIIDRTKNRRKPDPALVNIGSLEGYTQGE